LIEAHVLSAERLHGDDTHRSDPGEGQDRNWPRLDLDPSSATIGHLAARIRRRRSGEHPERHRKSFTGILQADDIASNMRRGKDTARI
jgi:transposase